MVKCSNIDSRISLPTMVQSILILIQEWAHLMVKCSNIDSRISLPDGSVS